MHFRVRSIDEARAAIDYFNAFHDGFVQSLRLVSRDRFESREAHVTTGLLDLEVVFTHNNYDQGRPEPNQRIEASFSGVRDFRAAFTGNPVDWPVMSFEILSSAQENVAPESRLRAVLVQPRLTPENRWERAEAMTFSFSSAEFREI